MAERLATGTRKDDSGGTTSLCGAWGTQAKGAAILDTENNAHRYYAPGANGTEANVTVVQGDTGKYLRTEPGMSKADNLQSLPDW